jgi:hypothetical protein
MVIATAARGVPDGATKAQARAMAVLAKPCPDSPNRPRQSDVASTTNGARIASSTETEQRLNILMIGTSGLARN